MNKFFAIPVLAALLLALALPAQARDWQIDPAASTLGFTASYQNEPFDGQFKDFSASIHYDPEALDQARFDVKIPLSGTDTASRMRDQTLKGGDFFAVKQFPEARFVTTSFERGADGRVTAHGTLTLHGITQPVALAVDFKPEGAGATLEVHTTLDRHAFKLGSGSDWVDIANEVEVKAHLVLR